jgi:hemin uptake protein HemP
VNFVTKPPSQPTPSDEPPHDESAMESASIESVFPKILKFESLARCGDEVWIENNGQIYRLRRTKQDKLILTK